MAELSKPLGTDPSEQKATILLVDDNPANLLSLRTILNDLGQNIAEASTGEEAFQYVQADEFAVILLNVEVPGSSGFETAKLVRTNARSKHTPIIFLADSEIDGSQLEEGYSLGAVGFIVKTDLPLMLQAKVRSFVQLFLDKQHAKQESEQFRLLVQGSVDYAIFMLDLEGHILTWNLGAERLKGYKADEIIGQHLSRFYPSEAIERKWPQHELEVTGIEGRFEDEGWRLRKDGSRFWANVVITSLRDENGNPQGFSKVTRDLTERRQAEENIRQLLVKEAALKAAEARALEALEARALEALEARNEERRQRERFYVTLASIGDGVIVTDEKAKVTFLNSVAEQLTGWNWLTSRENRWKRFSYCQ